MALLKFEWAVCPPLPSREVRRGVHKRPVDVCTAERVRIVSRTPAGSEGEGEARLSRLCFVGSCLTRLNFNRDNIIRPLAVWLLLAASGANAADDITAAPATRREIRDQGLVVSLSPRTPDQLYAFYSARGFPEDALQQITSRCFLTIGIRNERSDVVWLELDNWRFIDRQGRDLARIKRVEWHARWDRIHLMPAQRAAFNWTQLPERRDLQPAEPVGGNVSLVPPGSTFTLEATFLTGADKRGPALRLRIENLTCPGSDPT